MIERLRQGLPLDDIFIFDCHAHIGSGGTQYKGAPGAEDIVRIQKKLGINASCISDGACYGTAYSYGHDQVIRDVQDYKGRIFGYVVINPRYPVGPEIEKCFAVEGFLGFKINQAFSQIPIDDTSMYEGCEYANKHKLPVLIHTWQKHEVQGVLNLAKMFPDAPFIIGHSAMTYPDARQLTVDAIKKYDNVFADIVLSSTYEGSLEWLVDKAGSEKLLYGSDTTAFDCRQILGRVVLAKIKEEDKIRILGENAKKIFPFPEGTY